MKIVGIETSCDETAAALYDTSQGVCSQLLFSQIELHASFGGVVPETASRSHIEKIRLIVAQTLHQASLTPADVDAFAVTCYPGLPGSLLIGLCFAKGLAYATGKKIIGINHLEGHIFSPFLEHTVPFPHLCLVASGGHTALYHVIHFGHFTLIGTTVDDAAGEALDKSAKLLGMHYPGGPQLELYAEENHFRDTRSYPRLKRADLSFSFSGLKTAVLYDLVKRGYYSLEHKKLIVHDIQNRRDVASSLLVCMGDIFIDRLERASQQYPVKAITFVGGVACNSYLKMRIATWCSSKDYQFAAPSRYYCTDNAAMIAYVGHYRAQQGEFSDFDLDITPTSRSKKS